MFLKLKTIKSQLIIFLSLFAIYLAFKNKDAIFLLACLIAVSCAVFLETVYLYLKDKTFQITESSIISGLIIGYVLSSQEPLWIIMLASFFSILSKYLIRIKQRHIFNPAGSGIFLAIIILQASTQWKGTYAWYCLIPFGIYFISKIKKLELLISYFLVSIVLFGSQALIQKAALGNILGFFSYFFIFVMLIEPKTTPVSRLGKIIFGAGIALLIFIFTELGLRFDAELGALLIFNTLVPLLNKF